MEVEVDVDVNVDVDVGSICRPQTRSRSVYGVMVHKMPKDGI